MNAILNKILFSFKDKSIRSKILFILFAFLIFRLFAAIPLDIVDQNFLKDNIQDNAFLGMINMFTGGGLMKLSLVMFGVMPYITASIIMQLLGFSWPKIKAMQQEEGDAGRRKIGNYSRLLSIPLAAIQGFGFLHLLQIAGYIKNIGSNEILIAILLVTTGSVFLMWLGELISEFGIGNGLSLMIFAGIVSVFPGTIGGLYNTVKNDFSVLPEYLMVAGFLIFMIYAIVYITEASRLVPVHNSKTARAGQKAQSIQSTIPIKLNQAGVIPIIFAGVVIALPGVISSFYKMVNGVLPSGSIWEKMANMSNNYGSVSYTLIFFLLVFVFTFFYTAVSFDPKKMAEDLQKGGTFVPGVRPGEETEEFFAKVTTRVTFVGALFLATVAIIPFVLSYLTHNPALAIGGTSILIVVSVAIDLIRKIDAQISVRKYLSE